MDVPCKNCQDRTAQCHGVCELYIAFHKWREECLKQRNMQNTVKHVVGNNFVHKYYRNLYKQSKRK